MNLTKDETKILIQILKQQATAKGTDAMAVVLSIENKLMKSLVEKTEDGGNNEN